MTTRELLRALGDAGVTVSVDGDRLRVKGPAGALTPALRTALDEHRDALRRLLGLSAGPEPLPPAPPSLTPFPLSHPQQRIWFLDQMAGGQAAYVIPAAVLVDGDLDTGDLRRAVSAVVARHDALRTQVTTVDGAPLQVVLPHVDVDVPIESLEDLPAADRRAEAARRVAAAAAAPFDLARAPLFRTGLFRIDARTHVWFLCIHHLIADGTSLRLLLHEVLETCGDMRDGTFTPRPPAPVQYGSFVAWQQARLDSPAASAMQAYWREALAGVAPLELVTDRPRTADRGFAGGAVLFSVPADVTDRLRRIARDQSSSLYGVLLTAFQVLMARCAGQRDVAVGTVMANRVRPEFEPLVGCLANTVVIRSDVDPAAPFPALLARIGERVRLAWTHQELPFERLVESQPQRDAGRNPIFDVFFALNVPVTGSRAGLHVTPVFVEPRAAKFELALFCEEAPDGLQGLVEFQTDLWNRATVERLMARFVAMLEGIATDASVPVGALPFFAPGERETVEAGWRATRRPFSREATVHGLILAQARRTPEAIAATCEDQVLDYAGLDRRSGRVAAGLRAAGVGPGTLVGVAFERSLDMLVALLGVWRAGAAYVPLDPAMPAERLRFIASASGIDRVLTGGTGQPAEVDQAVASAVPDPGAPTLRLDDLEAANGAAGARLDDPGADASDPEALAYVLYTSGSTGQPKGVEVTHRNVVNFLESMAREPGLAPDDVLLAVTTLSFDIAVLELFLPWVVGARTVVASRETASDGARLAAAVAAGGVTVMQATPSTWRMLLEAGFRPDGGLRVLCGGEALSPALAAQLTSGGATVWNLYGPTETTVWSAISRVRPGAPPDLGHPIANTAIYVLDADRRPVPPGVAGELFIGGEGVARGYRGRPDLTGARFLPDPFAGTPGARMYATGDRGALGANGALRFLGRADDQLKIRGFRIEPAEIEAALAQRHGVQQVAVVGRRGPDDDMRLVAYLRCEADTFAPDSFRRFLGDRLPSYMIPSAFIEIDEMPVTPNGKLDRAALAARAVDVQAPAGPADTVAPRDAIEAQIAGIWRQVLGVEQVGVRDPFFALGGHSLLAARVVSRVESSTGVRLPINLFVAQPTIEEHARFVARARADREQRMTQLLEWVENLTEEEAVRYLDSQ